ncbi:MAG: hypothetical protein J6P40_10725 [Oscillospiraceae bacterium]|nr:hypothetical protein [Oscillospiraceae bacterium]
MDCKSCKERDNTTVSRGVFESVLARYDRNAKRLWIVILILIFLFVGTNIYWIWYSSQYEKVETTQTVTQDADNGINRFIGGNYYGSETDWREEGSDLIIEDADNAEEGQTDGNYDN